MYNRSVITSGSSWHEYGIDDAITQYIVTYHKAVCHQKRTCPVDFNGKPAVAGGMACSGHYGANHRLGGASAQHSQTLDTGRMLMRKDCRLPRVNFRRDTPTSGGDSSYRRNVLNVSASNGPGLPPIRTQRVNCCIESEAASLQRRGEGSSVSDATANRKW